MSLEQTIEDLEVERDRLLQHVENLQRMNEAHCARIVAQSELITKLVEEKRCQAKTGGRSDLTPPKCT